MISQFTLWLYKNKEKFNKIVSILGPFHTQVAFITAIAKRFEGSGLSDIFVSASIIADKSVDQAMRGKRFKRIVRALQLTYEALQWRIIQKSLDEGISVLSTCMTKLMSYALKMLICLQSYSSIKRPNFFRFLGKMLCQYLKYANGRILTQVHVYGWNFDNEHSFN